MNYNKLYWPEVEKFLGERWLIIPVGSIEQHGPHLPLGVDSILAEKIALALSKNIGGIVAPVIAYGARSLPNSGGGNSYPGTINLSGHLLIQMYEAILKSYIKNGAKQILFLNGHWENESFLVEAAECCRDTGIINSCQVIVLSWWTLVEEEDMLSIFGEFNGWHVEHAGQAETALMLNFAPDDVEMKNAVDHKDNIPNGLYKYPTPITWTGNKGILSRTSHVTTNMGKELSTLIIERLNEFLIRKTP